MNLWYHGTNAEAATLIRRTGFKPGTWFAAHLEDAIAFGGMHVFEVYLREAPTEEWLVCSSIWTPTNDIVAYHVFSRVLVFDRPDLRKMILEENRNGGVQGLAGKVW